MGNKDHLPKFPPCADEAPTGKKLTPYDKEHFRLYLYLRLWLMEGATREELYEHMFYIDGKAEPERARRMFDSHLERSNWAYTAECFEQLLSPELRRRLSKKGRNKSAGHAASPKHRKKSAS